MASLHEFCLGRSEGVSMVWDSANLGGMLKHPMIMQVLVQVCLGMPFQKPSIFKKHVLQMCPDESFHSFYSQTREWDLYSLQ